MVRLCPPACHLVEEARHLWLYSDVSYYSVEALDREWHIGLARVLGHVMAHELGHLVLGSNAHSRQGIMCPNWHRDELHLASTGSLLFSEEQALLMQERLIVVGAVRPTT